MPGRMADLSLVGCDGPVADGGDDRPIGVRDGEGCDSAHRSGRAGQTDAAPVPGSHYLNVDRPRPAPKQVPHAFDLAVIRRD